MLRTILLVFVLASRSVTGNRDLPECAKGEVVNMGAGTCVPHPSSDKYIMSCGPAILNRWDGTCIEIHENPKTTFEEARKICQQRENGDLLQPGSIASHQFVAGILQGPVQKRRNYRIGLKKPRKEVTVVNLDGSALSFDAPWRKRCVEMVANRGGRWRSRRCNSKRPFICQFPAKWHNLANDDTYLTPYELLSCDFESRPCFHRTLAENNAWVLVTNGSIPDITTHSKEGHYLTFNSDETPIFYFKYKNVPAPSCLSVWYQGGSSAEINVLGDSLFNPSYTEKGAWVLIEYSVYENDDYIEGFIKIEKSHEDDDVMIDDLAVYSGPCHSG